MKEVQLIFGYHACVGALKKKKNRKIISMKCTEDFYVKHKNLIKNRKIKDFEIVNRRIIDIICKNNFHQGVFINCEKLNKNHLDEIHNDENIIIILDSLNDSQNVGSIIRTAFCLVLKTIIFNKDNSFEINSFIN